MQRSETGKIVRIDTTNFTPSGVSFLDLPTMKRNQVPDHPDNDLRGFIGGFTSGKYGFLVPYFNGATFSGKICRVDLETFDGIQVLDISQEDPDLKGFYGGTVSIEENPLDVSLFGEFRTFPGTTTPYQYQY
jgi:hypothetical protein